MWSRRSRFTCSTSAAKVVDFPLPIEPVTRIRPLWKRVSSFRLSGKPSSSIVRMRVLIMRKTMIDPESLPNDTGAEASETAGIGKVDVAAFG